MLLSFCLCGQLAFSLDLEESLDGGRSWTRVASIDEETSTGSIKLDRIHALESLGPLMDLAESDG